MTTGLAQFARSHSEIQSLSFYHSAPRFLPGVTKFWGSRFEIAALNSPQKRWPVLLTLGFFAGRKASFRGLRRQEQSTSHRRARRGQAEGLPHEAAERNHKQVVNVSGTVCGEGALCYWLSGKYKNSIHNDALFVELKSSIGFHF